MSAIARRKKKITIEALRAGDIFSESRYIAMYHGQALILTELHPL